MVQLELTFPTWVQQVSLQDKPHFQLRPLFVPFPQVTNQRYQSALTQLKKEVQNAFKYPELDRNSINHLQWFMFRPELQMERVRFQFNLGKHAIDGAFMIIRFKVRGLACLYLPACDHMMLIERGTSSADRREQLQEAIKKYFKQERDLLSDEFNPQQYYAGRKDFLTDTSVKVSVSFVPNTFERQQTSPMFAHLFQSDDFQGMFEVYKVARDLTEEYPDDLQRAYFREEAVQQLRTSLLSASHTPLVLVGREGIGRHTVLHELVYQYVKENQVKEHRFRSVFLLDPTRVIAGMSIVGMWQKRFEAILQFLIKPSEEHTDPHVLVVDNPIALLRIGTSASNSLTLSDVLKPYLEQRKLPLLLVASPQEWAVFQEKDRSLSELFQVHRLEEPKVPTAIRMILEKRKWLEGRHQVEISISAIQQLLFIQRNYLSQKALPGAIVGRLEQLAIKHRESQIDARKVRDDFQLSSGLQSHIFDNYYVFEPNEVRKVIRRSLIGQESAVEALTQVVHLYKAKLNNPEKPVSSLLFIGPTGVGKTQAAKVLAEYLLGGENHLLRYDMNEYVDPGAAQRLLGDYFNPEGQLTGKVRYQPFSIILLDEIEKAHAKVRDLLLQVLDDGRLTDSLGRTVDFTNSIIIMTSNLGADAIGRAIQLTDSETGEEAIYRREMQKHFRPEFINRIDQTVVFRKLGRADIQGIARLQIKELLGRDGFVRRTTILNIQREALQWVADRGYDARMGGRALRRQIERDLTFLSAEQLLRVRHDGPIILNITLEGDHLKPSIHPLAFAEPRDSTMLSDIPSDQEGSRFYRKLGQAVDRLREQVARYEAQLPDDFDKDWRYYQFKTQLDVVKQDIQTIRIAYSDRYYREALATPLRLKQTRSVSWRDDERSSTDRGAIRARLFQEAALRELSDAYRFAPSQFDNLRSEFIDKYLTVALTCLFGEAFLANKYEVCTLRIESMIADQGKPEIKYLLEKYAQLFEHLDLPYQLDRQRATITAEGYGLCELLTGEVGIHLFYVAHRNPLPVRIQMNEPADSDAYSVIRIYDGTKTLTDIRTSFTNAVHMTPQEFKLLLYTGLPDERRAEILKTS